jgi:hypothetical protein
LPPVSLTPVANNGSNIRLQTPLCVHESPIVCQHINPRRHSINWKVQGRPILYYSQFIFDYAPLRSGYFLLRYLLFSSLHPFPLIYISFAFLLYSLSFSQTLNLVKFLPSIFCMAMFLCSCV